MEIDYACFGLVLFLGWSFLSIALGQRILFLCRFKFENLPQKLIFSAALGWMAISLCLFFLGILGILYKVSLIILFLSLLIFTRCPFLKFLRKIYSLRQKLIGIFKKEPLIVSLFTILLLLNLIACFSPPLEGDSIYYHLTLPKLYSNLHHIAPLNHFQPLSSYPQYLQLLYLPGIIFNNDTYTHLLHFSFGLLIAIVIFSSLFKSHSISVAIFAVLLFYSIPVVSEISRTAMIDLGAAFFEIMAFFAFMRWTKTEENKWLMLAGAFVGFCLGARYFSAFFFIVLTLGVGLYWLFKKKAILGFKPLAWFAILAVLVASPWYIKNLLYSGNPFYPFLGEIFNVRNLYLKNLHLPLVYSEGLEKIYNVFSFKKLLLFPFEFTFGLSLDRRYWNPIFSPLYLSLVPLIVLGWKNLKQEFHWYFYLSLGVLLFWFFLIPAHRFVLSAVAILTIPTALSTYYFASQRVLFRKTIFVFTSIWFFLAIGANIYYNYKPLSLVIKYRTRDRALESAFKDRKRLWDKLNQIPQGDKLLLICERGLTFYYINCEWIIVEQLQQELSNVKQQDYHKLHYILENRGISHILITEGAQKLYPQEFMLLERLKREGLIKIIYQGKEEELYILAKKNDSNK